MKAFSALLACALLAACDHDSPARFNPDGVQSVSVPEPAPFLLLAFGVAAVLVARRMRR